jgi:hypothetical protein
MDNESQCQDRHHDVDERSGHEVATQLEKAVSGGEQLLIRSNHTELSGEGVDHGEEIDRAVKQKENKEEGTTDSLDELPADRIMERVRHYRQY